MQAITRTSSKQSLRKCLICALCMWWTPSPWKQCAERQDWLTLKERKSGDSSMQRWDKSSWSTSRSILATSSRMILKWPSMKPENAITPRSWRRTPTAVTQTADENWNAKLSNFTGTRWSRLFVTNMLQILMACHPLTKNWTTRMEMERKESLSFLGAIAQA